MQDVFVEKPYKFVPPLKQTWPSKLALKLGLHKWQTRSQEGVIECVVHNGHRLEESVAAGHGVMLTPNHPRVTDPSVMCHVMAETGIPFYVMASWHLFNQNAWMTFVIRAMGAFSVNREGLDKAAVDFAVNTLQNAERPLLLFPEGTTSRTNDRLMALMDGPAFIARTAAKRRKKKDGGKVVVHPVGIRYLYQGDVDVACEGVLSEIEKNLTWRPSPEKPLVERIIEIGDALLRLKELQYGLLPDNTLSLKQRQNALVDRLLHPLEEEWLDSHADAGIGVAIRIKNLRMKIFPELSRKTLPADERTRRWRQLEDTYLAQQIDCYPEQYLTEYPSVDRILETVNKFEEDLNDRVQKQGKLKVIIDIDEAIEVSGVRDRKAKTDPLMDKIRERLEAKIAELQVKSRMY